MERSGKKLNNLTIIVIPAKAVIYYGVRAGFIYNDGNSIIEMEKCNEHIPIFKFSNFQIIKLRSETVKEVFSKNLLSEHKKRRGTQLIDFEVLVYPATISEPTP